MAKSVQKVICDDCGKPFDMLEKAFLDHLAYEHEEYVSIWYMIKGKTRKIIKKLLKR